MNSPKKQAQPDDLTTVTYLEDDTSSSMFSYHAPVVREVPGVLLSSLSNPYQNSAQNEVSETDSDSSSDGSSECSGSSDDFAEEDYYDEENFDEEEDFEEEDFDNFEKDDQNPSAATSRASPNENTDWKAAGSKLSFQQQEAVLEDMVHNLTLKLAQHQKKNERYLELFSSLDDTQEHIHSLNQRAKVLEAALVIQNVTGGHSGRTKKIFASEADTVIQDVASLSEKTSNTIPSEEPRSPKPTTSLSWRMKGLVPSPGSRPPLGDRQRSVASLSERTSRTTSSVKPTPTLGERQRSDPGLSERTSRTTPRANVKPRPTLGDRQRSVPSLSEQTSGSSPSVKPRPTLGARQRSVPDLSERTSRTSPTPNVKPRPTLGARQRSVPDLNERTSRTPPTPNVKPRPTLGDRQRSVPNGIQREAETPVRTPAAPARPFANLGPTRGKKQEKLLVAKHTSSASAASSTRHVQSEESGNSIVDTLVGEMPRRRNKIVRKIRRVPRKTTEPEEFDLRSPCKAVRDADEAAFQVKVPKFVSPASSQRSSKREIVKSDIPLVLEIPFPNEEVVAPVAVKSPSVHDSHVDSVTPAPLSAGRRLSMNHSANKVVMVVANYRKSKDLKKARSLRSVVDPMTPVSSSTRRLPTMHQSARRAMADRDSKVLSKTSSLRSLLVNSKKVLSDRRLRSGADGGFVPYSEYNSQDDMRASFFGLDDFDDLASRKSTDIVSRNEVKTGLMIPPPPVWTQSEGHKRKEPLLDIGYSDTDDDNCSGRNSNASDLPLLG
jgi:hypothetical protein